MGAMAMAVVEDWGLGGSDSDSNGVGGGGGDGDGDSDGRGSGARETGWVNGDGEGEGDGDSRPGTAMDRSRRATAFSGGRLSTGDGSLQVGAADPFSGSGEGER